MIIYTQKYMPAVFLLLQVPGHQSVFINEPRLSDFKQVLLKEGIQAEFVGGVLVCNNMVAVRRVSVHPPQVEENAIYLYLPIAIVTISPELGIKLASQFVDICIVPLNLALIFIFNGYKFSRFCLRKYLCTHQ